MKKKREKIDVKLFISSVKKHRLLYDPDHPMYTNYRKRNKVWMEIGRLVDKNLKAVKSKWKSLRDCYTRHLRSKSAIKRNPALRKTKGASAKKYNYWPWAEHMKFMRHFVSLNPTVKTEEDSAGTLESLDESKKNRKHKIKVETNLGDKNDAVPNILPFDEIDLIFLGYAKLIKNFSKLKQVDVKLKIAKIINEAELSNYDVEEKDLNLKSDQPEISIKKSLRTRRKAAKKLNSVDEPHTRRKVAQQIEHTSRSTENIQALQSTSHPTIDVYVSADINSTESVSPQPSQKEYEYILTTADNTEDIDVYQSPETLQYQYLLSQAGDIDHEIVIVTSPDPETSGSPASPEPEFQTRNALRTYTRRDSKLSFLES